MLRISNVPRSYAWGICGGISELLGWKASLQAEAELWFGAHVVSASRLVSRTSFESLNQWEATAGRRLPYLLKVLAAAQPLSLQAHPSTKQASEGYAREEQEQIPLGGSLRNYKDPYAKPELVVAVRDGFEALCGFRPIADVAADLALLESRADDPSAFARWRELLSDDLARTVAWLLTTDSAIGALGGASTVGLDAERPNLRVAQSLLERYPGDPGAAVSLMLNHVVLNAGDALWLAPGTIHSYLGGIGIELMGSSDNVLRGGLTVKHVDVPELLNVLDFRAGPPPRLEPLQEGEYVRAYIPSSLPSGEGVDFWLRKVVGDSEVRTAGPAIVLVIEGEFMVETRGTAEVARRGDAFFCPDDGLLSFKGSGCAFVAAT